ncbi:hypothetical protein [Luteibacter yeojuensis]|uniref:Uncharacterized protein n=1 Tax=Luteibacter yeojuensis TaxID=345309 RepID=A0A7X5QW38_9GAMM|nr:hypothetical protein [Luteibacter yeojuensis]NID16509.1 hypothetical protein [Luteibacter yeojuensis]
MTPEREVAIDRFGAFTRAAIAGIVAILVPRPEAPGSPLMFAVTAVTTVLVSLLGLSHACSALALYLRPAIADDPMRPAHTS